MFSGPRQGRLGRGRYNLLEQAINNKPFQCSDGRDSPLLRRTAARVEQGDLFKFYARSRLLISAHLWACSKQAVLDPVIKFQVSKQVPST